eukprot:3139777-Pyramimonas_sp.AAC.1
MSSSTPALPATQPMHSQLYRVRLPRVHMRISCEAKGIAHALHAAGRFEAGCRSSAHSPRAR